MPGSKTRESSLSRNCVACLAEIPPKDYKKILAERIENSSGNGTADLSVTWMGIECWIELKTAAIPVRATTPIDLKHIRPGQVQWHRRRKGSGQLTWILIQVGVGADRCILAFHGSQAKWLREGQPLDVLKDRARYWAFGGNIKATLRDIIMKMWEESYDYSQGTTYD